MNSFLEIVECPRDAMQGWKRDIPTAEKVAYLQALLRVGFPILDCGSFVSPKAIPQMRDTALVLGQLDLSDTNTKLLVIVANSRGVAEAVAQEKVHYLGFPLSVSETFQQRNTNKSIAEAVEEVHQLQEQCRLHGKEAVVYLSMAFGNPYGDAYNPDEVAKQARALAEAGIQNIALADTIGVAGEQVITRLFQTLVPAFPEVVFSAHFHTTPDAWQEKVEAAWNAGCRRFDGAIGGIGGCPMAKEELVGNMPTEQLVQWSTAQKLHTGLDAEAFSEARWLAQTVFI